MRTNTLSAMMKRFEDEAACKAFLQERRWPNGVTCPRCNNPKVFALKSRPFHWVCKGKTCGKRNGYRFSVISKTIFENTNYPLKTWFQVIYLMLSSKKGMSAHQLHRMLGITYKSAWFMLHRIRLAMQTGDFGSPMGGVLAAVYLRGAQWLLPGNWQILASGAGVLAVLLLLPDGLGGAWYRFRDRVVALLVRGRPLDAPGASLGEVRA